MSRAQGPENLIERPGLRDKVRVFDDRHQAGAEVAGAVREMGLDDPIVFAIPSGGIPIGVEVALALDIELRMMPVRKMTLPFNPEAGFGAVSLWGDQVLNRSLLGSLAMDQEEIDRSREMAIERLERRIKGFDLDSGLDGLEARTAVLVDDGLASGFTMIAGVRAVKRGRPEDVAVAVPTGSGGAVARVSGVVDRLICLNVRTGPLFAVADAYRRWHDLSDEEVDRVLRRYQDRGKGGGGLSAADLK